MIYSIPYLNLIIIVAIIVLMIAMFAITYAETKKLNLDKYTIKNNNIIKGIEEINGINIVFFSDLHLGKFNQKQELIKTLTYLKSLGADIYIFGGDLIGNNIKKYYSLEDISECFKIFNDKCLVSIYGNHEYKNEKNITTQEKLNYFKAMNCIILNNSYYTFKKENSTLSLYGMNDYIYNDVKINETKVDLIISHEGDIINRINNQIMLSGHTHGGQIRLPYIPIYYRPKNGKKYTQGLYKVNNSKLIVSKGLGYNGIKIRLFAPRDIIQINFIKEE